MKPAPDRGNFRSTYCYCSSFPRVYNGTRLVVHVLTSNRRRLSQGWVGLLTAEIYTGIIKYWGIELRPTPCETELQLTHLRYRVTMYTLEISTNNQHFVIRSYNHTAQYRTVP